VSVVAGAVAWFTVNPSANPKRKAAEA
jgi:hypothetical protein